MTGYVSPFGPKMKPTPTIAGRPVRSLGRLGITAGAFAGVALGTVIYLGEGIPRLQRDIYQKLPIIGSYWTGREKPASDNPF